MSEAADSFRKLPKQFRVPLDEIGSGTLDRELLLDGMEGEGTAMATLGVRKQPKCLRPNRREAAAYRSPEARLFPEISTDAGSWGGTAAKRKNPRE